MLLIVIRLLKWWPRIPRHAMNLKGVAEKAQALPSGELLEVDSGVRFKFAFVGPPRRVPPDMLPSASPV